MESSVTASHLLLQPGPPFRRRRLHEAYGGQRQGGISTPSDQPLILLFTGDTGEQYGYRDAWLPDGTFRYTGEGQVGDMTFARGNRAIRDHAADGKDLYLFEKTSKGYVQYLGQMVCAGYDWIDGVPDVGGDPRRIIVFYLQPIAGLEPLEEATTDRATASGGTDLRSAPLEQLRAAALAMPVAGPSSSEARRTVYRRSEAVRAYVLRRANGWCEGCSAPAPFTTPQGRAYLEPHHTRRLSDGGPDHPDYVVALCPNCHRRVHHGADGPEYNRAPEGKLGASAP